MQPFLIVKTGSTLPTLSAHRGDFEDWFVSGLGIEKSRVMIVDVQNGGSLPACTEISGVAVTGSHEMVTDRLVWSEKTAEWLRGAVTAGLPILAVCYGH
ncbi:MAG: GMP synthase, partial [Desulfobacteraceae bacterium]